ncbi:MAG: neutral/alkaline non-lysosomal ceramidase N-terminal domain-containing protein [Verrucomicrobia bacterium]|nr:neutral/alkaline non-lysosomal ceramidase N-terminal domain-containing protein [Verrucomicrobiota bacterium]
MSARSFFKLAGMVACVIFALPMRGSDAPAFRAAVVKMDITPDTPQMLRGYSPRMSTKVHDRIYHRIVALDDGATSFVLISSDLCSLSPAYCDRVTGNLAKDLGLPPENIWWSITHTHSSPYVGTPGLGSMIMTNRFQFRMDETYTALVEKTLVDGVRQARQKLEPAKLGVGRGYAEANINRRARDADGQVRLGMNPSAPVDRRIGLLRLDKAGGAPLVLIANYAMHATVLGASNTVVSADAPGVVAEYVEEKTGAPMLYLNGAAGNLAPIYSTRLPTEVRLLSQFKVLLGDPILDANRRLRATTAEVKLRASRIIIETPKRPGLKWSDELKDYLRVAKDGAETLLVPLRFLRINNDTVIWSAPMELFCEIASDIRDRSPFLNTLYVGYTNGTFGYLPTEQEFLAGGYESATNPFTASAAGHLSAAVNRHLREVHTARN